MVVGGFFFSLPHSTPHHTISYYRGTNVDGLSMQRYNATTRAFIFNVDKGVKTEAKNLLEGQRLI